jgi:hypothetical protein
VRTLALLLAYAVISSVCAADSARLTSICDCIYTNAPCDGDVRWNVKTATEKAPHTGVSKRTPTAIAHWPDLAPDPHTHTYRQDAPRAGNELKWFEVTGRVTLIRAEDDGDFHIQIQDPKGTNGSVNLAVEVPAGEPWCKNPPPFNATGDELTLARTDAVIKVVGRAFYDGQHATTNHPPNLRMSNKKPTNVTIWEIHPVMDLKVVN